MLNLVSSVMLRDIFLKFPVLPSAGNKTATRRVVCWVCWFLQLWCGAGAHQDKQ